MGLDEELLGEDWEKTRVWSGSRSDDRGFFSFRGIKEVPGICVILEYLDSRLSGFDWIWCRILESMESNFERTQRNGDDRSKKNNLLFKFDITDFGI